MPASALALVITAALLHALWNIAAKKAGGDHRFVLMGGLLVALIWAPAALWLAPGELPRWGRAEWAVALASAITHLLYFNTLLKGYRESDLTVVYPVARGTGPLITAVAAVLLLGERLSLAGTAGVLAVAGGVFFVAGGPGLWAKAHDPLQRARVHAGLRWGALTGLLIATYTVVDGYGVKVMLMSPVLLDYFGNLLRLPFMLPQVLRDPPGAFREAWRRQWKYALLLAVVSPLGYILVLYAVKQAPLSHVAPAREVSMLFAALLGGRLLGEGDRGSRLLGAACIAGGVAALALG
jgi:drug/metabolite transporter (DMT)-like permease